MRRFVHRPSPALLVALIALSVALSGTATARGVIAALRPNSVTSKTVKDGSLRIADFNRKDGSRLRGDRGLPGPAGPAGETGPQGPPGVGGGYSKTDAEAAFLGKGAQAADSAKLGGNAASAFVLGGGTQTSGALLLTGGGADATLVAVPNLGKLKVGCLSGSPESMTFAVENDQSGLVRFNYAILENGTNADDIFGRQLAAGTSYSTLLSNVNSQVTLQLSRSTTAATYYGTVLFTAVTNPSGDLDKCSFQSLTSTSESPPVS